METIFTTELIQALGVGAIPIVIVAGVVYYLFQLLKERDKVMRDVVNTFNKTIQEHLNSNSQMIKQMISSFEEWRGVSTLEHQRILNGQSKILNKKTCYYKNKIK